jgi:hypothetical protein
MKIEHQKMLTIRRGFNFSNDIYYRYTLTDLQLRLIWERLAPSSICLPTLQRCITTHRGHLS